MQHLWRTVCCSWLLLALLWEALLSAGARAASQAQMPAPAPAFEFVALGDMPYSSPEVDRTPAFQRLIAAINRLQPAFSIHVGDIKSGSTPCDDATFAKIHALFMTFAQPLIYTPGDNEWTDCHRKTNGSYDPLERLAALRKLFFSASVSLGQTTLPLTRQSTVSDWKPMVENVRWLAHGVLFVTLHVVGSNNNLRRHPAAAQEFFARNAANLAWIEAAFRLAREEQALGMVLAMQADPGFQRRHGDGSGFKDVLDALAQHAAEFAKPVLIVHGDSHEFIFDQPLRHAASQQLLPNVLRLEVFGEPQVHAVRVFVQPQDPMLFRVQPLFVLENLLPLLQRAR
ncbi:MAG: hypothetical protein AB7N91_00210 [Candidatus Tectimicrobiota bacterium]